MGIVDNCLSCDAMGGPDGCCGVLEWKESGEVVCNECGLIFEIHPKDQAHLDSIAQEARK